MTLDEIYMSEALKEARKAFEKDEVPIGAIIVHNGKIIARAHNQVRMLKDPTAHAEMIAITEAANFFRNERLPVCSMYVTIEPCPMCAGALILARMHSLFLGADDSKSGACGSVLNIVQNNNLNHHIEIHKGILEADCSSLLKEFFQAKRYLKTFSCN
jgi:tRNA(adenine34) deaminase